MLWKKAGSLIPPNWWSFRRKLQIAVITILLITFSLSMLAYLGAVRGEQGCLLQPAAKCDGVNLKAIQASGVDLHFGSFVKADLRGANLSYSDLSNADLRGADLRGADLSGTDLRGANLDGADLTGAKR